MEALSFMRFREPTPVQKEVIPAIMQGKDVIACAQTGTGKTAAFLLPIMQGIIRQPDENHSQALVIVPTRELAVQIAQQAQGFGYFANISSIAVYGGGTGPDYANEQRAISTGTDVVICTPGRMLSHLNMGYPKFDRLQYLVLDEADRMLDMGFHDDIMRILSYLPTSRQSLLFSATMPSEIRQLARKILTHPVEINISLSTPPEKIRQEAFMVYEEHKIPMVLHLTADPSMKSILVFCDTKIKVKELTRELKRKGLQVEEIHSDLEQSAREAVMNRFKGRQTRVLVATDIVSRGIDVEDIDMVINFNVPHDAEDYVHRIGRTARAESDGRACTLIGPLEQRKFADIEKLLGRAVDKPELPDDIGKGPSYDPGRSGGRPSMPRWKQGGRARSAGDGRGGERSQAAKGKYRGKRKAGGGGQAGGDRQPSGDRRPEKGGAPAGGRPGNTRSGHRGKPRQPRNPKPGPSH